MPKAARRTSTPRPARYPAIKPGDQPSNTKTSPEVNAISTPSTETSKPTAKKGVKKTAEEPSGSFLDIKLDSEDDNTIPIYDTCSTIRQKINALLGKDNHKPENGMPGEVDKQGHPKPYTKVSFCPTLDTRPDMLARFLKAKKMMGGAESVVYPKAYAFFFEKKKIFDGKKKTPGREKVETEYAIHFLCRGSLCCLVVRLRLFYFQYFRLIRNFCPAMSRVALFAIQSHCAAIFINKSISKRRLTVALLIDLCPSTHCIIFSHSSLDELMGSVDRVVRLTVIQIT